jgi:hypothetical protein
MKYADHEPGNVPGNRRSRLPVGRPAGAVATAMPVRGAFVGGPLDRAELIAIQRLAGNAAATALVQRNDPWASDTYVAQTVRARGKTDTAAVIWRDAGGAIVALVEFESNAALDSYTAGTAQVDALVAAGRARWAELSVAKTALAPPSAAPQAPITSPPDQGSASSRWATLAKILATAYKQLRTGRILAFLAAKQTYDDAQKVIAATDAQLKMLRRQARGLANRITHSGGGPKVAAKLAEVEAEIAKLELLVNEQKAALRSAQAAMKAEQAAAKGLLARIRQLLGHEGVAKEKAASRLWKFAGRYLAPKINQLLRLLERSSSGVKFLAALRKLSSPWVGRVLIGATAVFEGINAYVTSKNRTTGGKVADATLTGASEALVVANPVTALTDLALPKNYKLSTMYRGGSGAITALGEGIVTGDISAMESFHEASKRGEYGKVMQLSSEAGDYWAEHGVIGGLKEFGRELWDWL